VPPNVRHRRLVARADPVRVELHGLEGRVHLPVQAALLALGEEAVLPLHEAV
jgi:hypothetical protein